jgi:hypothetical protein
MELPMHDPTVPPAPTPASTADAFAAWAERFASASPAQRAAHRRLQREEVDREERDARVPNYHGGDGRTSESEGR